MLKYREILFCCVVTALGASLLTFGCSREPQRSEKQKIRYANWEVYPAQLKLHQEVVDRFMRSHSDIDVEFEIVHGGP